MAQLGQLAELAQLVSAPLEAQRLEEPARPAEDWCGKLELLVLQPSPFCNLNCDYCYLPHRDEVRRMDLGTLEMAARKIFGAGLPARELSVVWHAGEPMAVPRGWYDEAFALLAQLCPRQVRLTHHFQTNGVLIDARWCEFIKAHDVHIGVSVDGPAWLHDRHRRTRTGRGTHARVMRGVEALRSAQIPFHVICVLTRESLSHADEIFDFFLALRPTCLCLNVEEVEAENVRSSLADADSAGVESAFRAFMRKAVARVKASPAGMRLREIDTVLSALRDPRFGTLTGNSQNQPGRMLNIAWDGSFTTFSPELLGARHPRLGAFSLGNVLRDALPPVANALYPVQSGEIARGIENCRTQCKYFDFCLGGAPANKLGELGRLDGTETMFCRLTQKATIDVVLAALENDLVAPDPASLALRCAQTAIAA